MRVSFRQGIVQYQVDNQNNQNFLLATSTGISLLANDLPFVYTIAHKDANYLIEEKLSIVNAWTGPFIPQLNYWLYIDLHPVTGKRTFGATSIQPFVGPYAPTTGVQVDYHWYDTSLMQMKVWNGHGWQAVIRLFVAQGFGGAKSFGPINNTVTYAGTTIGDNNANFSGNIVYDAYGKPLRASNQTFFTTESTTTVDGSTGNVRLAADLLTATALESIPAYSVVYFYDFDVIKLATPSLDIAPRIFGIVTQDLQPNDTCFVYTDCVITNDKWNWPDMAVSVYADIDGAVTTNQQLDQQSIGYVIAHNAIRVEPLAGGSSSSGGNNGGGNGGSNTTLTQQQLYDMMGKFPGALTITGPDTVVEGNTADYSLTFFELFNGHEIDNANCHIGVSGNVAMIDGNNRLYVPKLTAEQDVLLTAYYPYGLQVITATKTVHLAKQQPVRIQISGPSQIYEGTTAAYTTIATYPDGTTGPVTPVYSITQNNVAGVNASNLTVQLFANAGIGSTINLINDTITATFTTSTGVVLTSSMPLQYLRVLPVQLTVSGTSTLLSGASAPYVATVRYNNNTTKNVTTLSIWSLTDPIGLSSIGSATGILAAGRVYAPSSVTVKAQYTENNIVLNSTLNVQIIVGANYGTGPALPQNMPQFIASLPYQSNGKTADFAIDAIGMDTFIWYAYPASYGLASFYDVGSQMNGGWDGAGSPGDGATPAGGPIQITMITNGVSTAWYVYRTDHSNLGAAAINHWQVN